MPIFCINWNTNPKKKKNYRGGLLTLTGALAALDATPGMIGYGIAKAAVHHLVKDLAAPNGGLPEGCKVTAVLPYVVLFID